jgi:hypothetical protein
MLELFGGRSFPRHRRVFGGDSSLKSLQLGVSNSESQVYRCSEKVANRLDE